MCSATGHDRTNSMGHFGGGTNPRQHVAWSAGEGSPRAPNMVKPERMCSSSRENSTRVRAPAAFAALLFVFGASCTDARGIDPDADVVGANARFSFTLVEPEALREGRVDFTVSVSDLTDGGPVEGAEMSVRLTMPAMGHTSDPLATEIAPGRYRVPDALLDMPGSWVLRVRVEDDGLVDEAELPIQVP